MSIEVEIDLSAMERMFSDEALDSAQEQLTAALAAGFSENGAWGGFVPRDTGTLQDESMHVTAPDEITWEAEYAGYVYFGTDRMAGRPWFDQAAAAHIGDWEELAAGFLTGGAR